jgi:hypothetical protein
MIFNAQGFRKWRGKSNQIHPVRRSGFTGGTDDLRAPEKIIPPSCFSFGLLDAFQTTRRVNYQGVVRIGPD